LYGLGGLSAVPPALAPPTDPGPAAGIPCPRRDRTGVDERVYWVGSGWSVPGGRPLSSRDFRGVALAVSLRATLSAVGGISPPAGFPPRDTTSGGGKRPTCAIEIRLRLRERRQICRFDRTAVGGSRRRGCTREFLGVPTDPGAHQLGDSSSDDFSMPRSAARAELGCRERICRARPRFAHLRFFALPG